MFFFISKILVDQEIKDAIEKYKTGNPRERSTAWLDLHETFQPLIKSKFNSFSHLGQSVEEKDNILNFVIRTFMDVINKTNLDKNVNAIKSYLKNTLRQRVNLGSVEDELGHKSDIYFPTEQRWNRALKKFKAIHQKIPDTNNQDDVDEMARIMQTKPKNLTDFLATSRGHVKSIYEQTGEGEAATEFLDSLASNQPLPDKIFENKEFVKVLMQRIKKLSPKEQEAFLLTYHPEDLGRKEWGKEPSYRELADKMGIEFDQFRHLLGESKHKLENDPILKEFVEASVTAKLLKLARDFYDIVKVGNSYTLVRKNSESIINEVINARIQNKSKA